MADNRLRLEDVYRAFEEDAAAYKITAACAQGCAYCCTDAGSIDITTMEGLVIRDWMMKLPRGKQQSLIKSLAKDRKRRAAGKSSHCPFLLRNKSCMLYAQRPFSCRRIYSVHVCRTDNPPKLHLQVMEMAKETIRRLQRLDDTGYSGHLSIILHLLDQPSFLSIYMSGNHRPEAIADFGRANHIVINRSVSQALENHA
jgi:hypothetical protein